MKSEVERRLTNQERKTIHDIEAKAAARPHKPKYHPEFIVDYMLESFKDWDYECKQDAMDMLDAILEVAKKCKTMTAKQIEKERRYVIKEHIKEQFEDE